MQFETRTFFISIHFHLIYLAIVTKSMDEGEPLYYCIIVEDSGGEWSERGVG